MQEKCNSTILILRKNTLCLKLIFLLVISLGLSCGPDQKKDTENVHLLQGAGYGIATSILIVENVDSIQKYYSEVLGFSMPPFMNKVKKNFYEGTKSAFIFLPDLSAIEFLAIDDSDSTRSIPKPSFITSFLEQHEGIRMYSISSSSVDSSYKWLTERGSAVEPVRSYRVSSTFPKPPSSWTSQNIQIRSVDFDSASPPAYLPRFVEDQSMDYQRMVTDWKTSLSFGRMFGKQTNGVVGTRALQIAVEDLDAVREAFQKIGLVELTDDPNKKEARFKIKKDQEIILKAPESPDDTLARLIEDRGEGVFGLNLAVENLDTTYAFLKERLPAEAMLWDSLSKHLTVYSAYAKGVQLEFFQEPEERNLLAQKLKMGPKLDGIAKANAAELYQKYCALCHGKNREGYAADYAPSLRSHSLLATAKSSNFMRYTIHYGRANTAMAGYLIDQGGPLSFVEIELILQWLYESSGVEKPIELSREPVSGDIKLGEDLYSNHCMACHGKDGEGGSGPALGNPMLLATATDEFLRHAISEGRDNTLMPAFKDSLKENEINALTAFLRSRASGWDIPQMDSVTIPMPENYVLNPDSEVPDFQLREGRFVSAKQLHEALEDSLRIVLLDARSKVAWRQTHIPGAIPVPYYEEPEAFLEHIPNDDDTWIVAYCACPHAASGEVINTLHEHGYKKTAILDEGILVWAQLGYPVQDGN